MIVGFSVPLVFDEVVLLSPSDLLAQSSFGSEKSGVPTCQELDSRCSQYTLGIKINNCSFRHRQAYSNSNQKLELRLFIL
jgi:hypothetical protein